MSKLELWSDNHNVNQIGLHLVWCTKYRHPVLKEGIDLAVKASLQKTSEKNNWKIHAIEVMPDHVHLFIQIHPTDTPADVVKILKSESAVSVFYLFPSLKRKMFWGSGLWSRGTYYGSIGQVSQETVAKYIQMQKTRRPKKK